MKTIKRSQILASTNWIFKVALLSLITSICLAPALGQARKDVRKQKTTWTRDVKQYTIEQFMDTLRIGGSSFSPDEKSILFYSNKTGIFNVYSVPATGGTPKQLTNSNKESTFGVSYFPNDDRFIYTYDKGGNENSHL